MASHVFLSYVRENGPLVERLARGLESFGVGVWFDRKNLTPGVRWRGSIREAISEGLLFIACFSREYARRERSEMNEELTLAIEELRRRPANRTWFIPVSLDGAEVPSLDIGAGATLRNLQWVDLSDAWDDGVRRIAAVALDEHAKSTVQSLDIEQPSSDSEASRTRVTVDSEREASQEPDLRLQYSLQRGRVYWRNVSHDEIQIQLAIVNRGSLPAASMYIRLTVSEPFAIKPHGMSLSDANAPVQHIPESTQPPVATFVARNDFQIHPNVPIHFAQVMLMVKGNVAVPSCDIEYQIAASGVSGGAGVLHIEALEIAPILLRTVEPIEV